MWMTLDFFKTSKLLKNFWIDFMIEIEFLFVSFYFIEINFGLHFINT